jgi:hypothetical protein
VNIPEALTLVSKTIELTKGLRDIDHKIELAELRAKAADIYSAMADLKMALVDARDEIEDKNKEIVRLKKAFEFKGMIIERHNVLYEERDGNPIGMPFCPRCMDVDGRFIKLTSLITTGKPSQCPQCKSIFDRQTEYLAPQRKQ